MKITKIVSQLLESNVYVVEKDGEVVIIDSGCKLELVKEKVGNNKVVGILLTHGHFDHSAYCNDYAKEFDCKIYANSKIKETLKDKKAIYSEDGTIIEDFSKFEFIGEDCTLKIGNFEIKCYSCPGHSKCCESYLIDDNLFSGDFLFKGSIGRIDLVGSDRDEMYQSLCKLENIDYDKVFSGHGEGSDRTQQQKNISVYKRFIKRRNT